MYGVIYVYNVILYIYITGLSTASELLELHNNLPVFITSDDVTRSLTPTCLILSQSVCR